MRGLAGKPILVTGAARGIGRAIALLLAKYEARVGCCDIDSAGCSETTNRMNGDHLAVQADVADERQVAAAVEAVTTRFGGLAGVVNCAGVDLSRPAKDVTREEWLRLHDVDLWGAMLVVKQAHSHLQRTRGSVVNIASTHALASVPGRSAYAAAKAGLVGLTRALAVEMGADGIRVNAVLPGYVRTDIWRLWLDTAPDPEAVVRRIARDHPLRRVGEPADVAAAVAFLLSDDASFITGSTLVVDGGYTAQLEVTRE